MKAANKAPNRRQTEVLVMIAGGDRVKNIADKLNRSEAAIRERIHLMYAKIGARNAPHAVAIAMARGWIKPEDLQ